MQKLKIDRKQNNLVYYNVRESESEMPATRNDPSSPGMLSSVLSKVGILSSVLSKIGMLSSVLSKVGILSSVLSKIGILSSVLSKIGILSSVLSKTGIKQICGLYFVVKWDNLYCVTFSM